MHFHRRGTKLDCRERDAEEHHCEQDAHVVQGCRSVLVDGLLKGSDAVGYCLDTRKGGAPFSEGAEHDANQGNPYKRIRCLHLGHVGKLLCFWWGGGLQGPSDRHEHEYDKTVRRHRGKPQLSSLAPRRFMIVMNRTAPTPISMT